MKWLFFIGRSLQAMALLVMPSAIWVGHFEHNESAAISIFVGCIVVFFGGWLLSKAT